MFRPARATGRREPTDTMSIVSATAANHNVRRINRGRFTGANRTGPIQQDRMATNNDTGAASAPHHNLHDDLARLVAEASAWIEAHWLEIAIAAVAAVAVFLLLNLVRRWGIRLCHRSAGVTSWYGVAGRALSKTS